ncbi:MAG: Gfo/Idh/MocA family oxidoreductase [candidate division Zixibacteria bacterium]|nr:Gfo/Idh/MocA family oxidoreductase [candidate division Zixibacteria bacterium]
MFNVAVIGLGMGQGHLKGYSEIPDVAIRAIADIDESRLQTCAEQYRIPDVYTDYHQMLALDDIDLISVCLPNYLHAPVAIAALEAGKHTLVEKPMALNVSEAEAMVKMAKKRKKTLAVSMNYRWALGPDSLYLKHLIATGKLGRVYYVRSVSLRRRTFMRGHKTWFSDKQRSGGGGLIDMGPHMIDLAMWMAGDFSPVSVSGQTGTQIMTDTDIDDFAVGSIRMKNGVMISLESTWASHTRPGGTVTVMGTEGGAILDLNAAKGQRLTLFGDQEGTLFEQTLTSIHLPTPQPASVQEHVVESIRAGRTAENSAERGLAVMRVIDAIYRSGETGREVKITAE